MDQNVPNQNSVQKPAAQPNLTNSSQGQAGQAKPAQPVQQGANLDLALAPHSVDFFPPIIQSFSTLFSLFGLPVSANTINSILGNNPPSPAACVRAVAELGLVSKILYKPKIEAIPAPLMPYMALLKNHQTCIVLNIDNDIVDVIFPELGKNSSQITLDELKEAYSGYVIFSKLSPKVDKRVSSMVDINPKRWFWDVVFNFLPIYRQVFLASIAINLLALIGPLFFMNVYDRVVPNLAYDTLWVLALGVFLGYIFDFALKILRTNFTDKANKNINTIVTTRLMRKILEMRLEDRPESSGALINNIKEFDTLQDFFSAVSLLTVIDLPFLFLFLFVVLLIGGMLVYVPIAAIILLIILIFSMQFAIRRFTMSNYQGNVEKSSLLVEMVNGMQAIKMAVAENRMIQTWEKVVGYTAKTSTETKQINTLAVNLASLVTHLVSVSLIIWGVYLIGEGKLTMGGLIACNILTGRAMAAVMQVAGLMTRYQQAKVSLEVLNKLMHLPSERQHNDNLVDFTDLPHSIEFDQVTFAYKNSNLPIFKGLNLLIKPGEKVGVIGNMGSGKSTLGLLMCGLYTPSEGVVKFGGVDLRKLDMSELRSRVSFLSQNPMLFQGTIRENIALGAINVPDQLILRAAWISGAREFINNLPDGFAFKVAEGGNNLSGGQKQSIALARSLLHDPDVLILDEPTSNIDLMTESLIINRLKTVMQDKTLIVNMHRMSLLELTNRLIVLQGGKIIADGPTKEVVAWMNRTKKPTAPAKS